jgi:hypothetical protein
MRLYLTNNSSTINSITTPDLLVPLSVMHHSLSDTSCDAPPQSPLVGNALRACDASLTQALSYYGDASCIESLS